MPTVVPLVRSALGAQQFGWKLPRGYLASATIRQAPDGWHAVLRIQGAQHRLWFREAPQLGVPYAAELPYGPDYNIRSHASHRMWRAAYGRPPGPPFHRISIQRRERWGLVLRAADGDLDGASYRLIAQVLSGRKLISERSWKTDELRSRTIRLVQTARALIRGGYRALLRPASRTEKARLKHAPFQYLHRPNIHANAARLPIRGRGNSNAKSFQFHMHDLDGIAAEPVGEETSAYTSKSALLIKAFRIDCCFEPDWPRMAQSSLRYPDLQQASAEPAACGFGQDEQPGDFTRICVHKSNDFACALTHGHASLADKLFVKCRRALTHPALDLIPRVRRASKTGDRFIRQIENNLCVFRPGGPEGKAVVRHHNSAR